MAGEKVIKTNAKWVIIEVREVDGKQSLFVSPDTLPLPLGWVGDIIWNIYTPGWKFDVSVGVQFVLDTPFIAPPHPDPVRPGCWRTSAASVVLHQQSRYTVNVHPIDQPDAIVSGDPVVENEPPSPMPETNSSTKPRSLAATA